MPTEGALRCWETYSFLRKTSYSAGKRPHRVLRAAISSALLANIQANSPASPMGCTILAGSQLVHPQVQKRLWLQRDLKRIIRANTITLLRLIHYCGMPLSKSQSQLYEGLPLQLTSWELLWCPRRQKLVFFTLQSGSNLCLVGTAAIQLSRLWHLTHPPAHLWKGLLLLQQRTGQHCFSLGCFMCQNLFY